MRIIGFVLSLACLALIVYLSFAKSISIPRFVLGKDKGGHFLAYMALAFLFFLCFCCYAHTMFFRRNFFSFISASGLSFLCGYAIELCQPVFGRAFETMDLLADGLGSVSGSLLCFLCVALLMRIERRRSKR